MLRGTLAVAGALVAIGASAASVGAAELDAAAEPVPIGAAGETGERPWVPGEVVVRYAAGTSAADRGAALDSIDAESSGPLELNRARVVELPSGTTVREAVSELSADPAVDFAEPNYTVSLDSLPNDTFVGRMWGLENTGQTIPQPTATGPASFTGTTDADIDAAGGWERAPVEGGDASDVVVAIVDSGIDLNHPDLAPNLWRNAGEIAGNGIDDDANGVVDDVHGADFKNQFARTGPNPCTTPASCIDGDPLDDTGVNHGTHVAGTVGARGGDGYGVTGVAQRVQLMGVKTFDALDAATNGSVGNGFAYAVAEGADVVNASLGSACPSELIAQTIEDHPDVLFVVSAGNGGPDGIGDNNDLADDAAAEASPSTCLDSNDPTNTNRHPGQYPCNFNAGPEAAGYLGPAYDFDNVICVANSDIDDGRSPSSNYGPTSVQIAAPGDRILSTQPVYDAHLRETFEDPGFDGRLVDGSGNPITAATASGWRRVNPGWQGSFSFSESANPGNYAPSLDVSARPVSETNLNGARGCHLEWSVAIAPDDPADGVSLNPIINGGAPLPIGEAWASVNARRTPPVPELNNAATATWRVRFQSDADATTGAGAFVDDVGIRCLGDAYSPPEVGLPLIGTHKFLGGTSMATPHVAGAAALIRHRAPAMSPTQVIDRLMASGDANAAFATAGATPVESGRRLNLDSALASGYGPPPETPSIAGPSGVTGEQTPQFDLSTDQPGARFQCALDGGAFGNCTTPTSFRPATALTDGPHTLRVRAIGGLGGVSPTARRDFTVDSKPPVVTISKKPKKKTPKTKASFAFGADETAEFTCRLDRKPAKPCASPAKVKAKKGKHTFRITATDAAGNEGSTSYAWKVKKKKKRR